jgi:hypothetical protein
MHDAFLLTERYQWTMGAISEMDWSDFCAYVAGAKLMYDREQKAQEAANKGR